MKPLSLILLLICFHSPLQSQVHLVNIGLPDTYEYGNVVTVLPDGATLVCAVQYQNTSAQALDASDALLIKLSATNKIVWAKKLSSGRRDKFTAAVADGSGNIYVSGFYDLVYNSNQGTGFVLKLDASGTIIWQKSFPHNVGTSVSHITLLSDGNVAAAGTYNLVYGSNNALLVVLKPDGTLVYGQTYDLAYNGSPTNGDSFEKVFENNGELVALGIGRGEYDEYHNLFIARINMQDGSVIRCMEYDYSCVNSAGLTFNANMLNDAYMRSGQLIIAGINGNEWNSQPGYIFSILDIRMSDYLSSVTQLTYTGYSHCNISCMYPISNSDYFVMNMPSNSAIGPEQDNTGNPNASYTNTIISRVKNSGIWFSKSNADKGVRGFNNMQLYDADTKLIATGVSDNGNNQVGLQDIVLMKSDINLSDGNECTFKDDNGAVLKTIPYTARISHSPSESFSSITTFSTALQQVPFSSTLSAGVLSSRNPCACFRDSIIRDSICRGERYLLPTGQYVSQAGSYITDTIEQGTCNVRVVYAIHIYPVAVADAGSDQAVCAGDSVTLRGTGTGSLEWRENILNGKAFLPTVSSTYHLKAVNAFGCSHTDSVAVKVNPMPSLKVVHNVSACESETVTLTATGTGKIEWSGGIINGQAFVPPNTGMYYVNIVNTSGCKRTDSTFVLINPLPDLDAGEDTAVCAGDSVRLTAHSDAAISWDNNVINGKPFITMQNSLYHVIAYSDSGCVKTDSVSVIVNSLPLVDAGPDRQACPGDILVFSARGAASYHWNKGIKDKLEFVFSKTDTFTVTGTDANGCKASDTVILTADTLEHAFYLPNSFSPDRNRINDVFYPAGQGFIMMELSIYNRWGELIYTDASQGWDGTYKGTEAPEGIYMVMIVYRYCTQDVRRHKQTFTLFR